MLTLILLVVLCGGAALLAVSLAEDDKPATFWPRHRRGPDPDSDATQPRAVEDDAGDLDPFVIAPPPSSPSPQPAPPPPQPAPPPPQPAPPTPQVWRTDADHLPSSRVAVEGALGELAVPSTPRRLASALGIILIAVLCGVVVAAVLGAVVGGVSQLLGDAIG